MDIKIQIKNILLDDSKLDFIKEVERDIENKRILLTNYDCNIISII